MLHLYDTATREVRELALREPGTVSVYLCGPTVYGYIHVGNARPFVVYSQFKRFLEHEGYDVTFVANVTDVNDKIYDAARPRGIPSAELAEEMTAAYTADTDRLGLGRPDHEPLASGTIGPIVDLIQALIDRDAAYAVEGDVYFRVRADGSYGELSHRAIDDMDQGEGVDGLSRKEDPLDFALWKAQKEGEDTAWDAPWGRGRPGWHIECSAMSCALLGEPFDIHGGGMDLTFPHHENEIAQSEGASGRPFVKTWVHNGFLNIDDEKMSKSLGNFFTVRDVLPKLRPEVMRVFVLASHYRGPINYSDESLRQADAALERLYLALRGVVGRPMSALSCLLSSNSPPWEAPTSESASRSAKPCCSPAPTNAAA